MRSILIAILLLTIWPNQSDAEEIKLNCLWLETTRDESFNVDSGVRFDFDANELLYSDFFLSVNSEGCAFDQGRRWGEVERSEKWIQCRFLRERKNYQDRSHYFVELDKFYLDVKIDRFTGKATQYQDARTVGKKTESFDLDDAGGVVVVDGKFKMRKHPPQEYSTYHFLKMKFQCNLAEKLF